MHVLQERMNATTQRRTAESERKNAQRACLNQALQGALGEWRQQQQ